MKSWNIEIYIVDDHGKEYPASVFTKAVYNLHPSFEKPVQSTCIPRRISLLQSRSANANLDPSFP